MQSEIKVMPAISISVTLVFYLFASHKCKIDVEIFKLHSSATDVLKCLIVIWRDSVKLLFTPKYNKLKHNINKDFSKHIIFYKLYYKGIIL